MDGNTSGWHSGDHTRNRKWSGLEDIDHYPCHTGYIWGKDDFPEAAGSRVEE